MAGKFEVFLDAQAQYRFRLTTPDGTELAVSGVYPDKASAVAAIETVRECAGMGLITDLCPSASSVPAPAAVVQGAALPVPAASACDTRRVPVDGFRKHAAVRRATPQLTGAA